LWAVAVGLRRIALNRIHFNIANHPAAIAPRPPGSVKLVGDDFLYFIGGMMPESANPVQQSLTVIEIRAIPRGAF